METGIEKVVKDGNGNAIIFTALIAAAIANSLPTPMDAIYFSRQSKLKDELEAGKITPKQYWLHDVGGYYFYTSLWYLGLIVGVSAIGGTYKTNSRFLLAMVSAGLVVGVVYKNIKKDEDLIALHKQQQEALSAGQTTTT